MNSHRCSPPHQIRRRRSWSAIALLACLLVPAARPLAAAPSHSDEELISAALEVYNEFSDMPLPFLDREQLENLAAHRVVRVRRSGRQTGSGEETHEEAVGYILIERARKNCWVAALDPDFEGSELLTEVRISRDDEFGDSRWYQFADLPWPITDRHWVIDLSKNRELAESTQGFIWEHRWSLAPDGPSVARQTVAGGRAGDLTLEKIEKAIYLPYNRGGWVHFSLEEGRTLVVYRVSADVGGSIPESWIATFAMAQLEGLLQRLAGHVDVATHEYDPDTYPIRDGYGEVLPAANR